MPTEMIDDTLALVAKTQVLLHRAADVLHQGPRFGPGGMHEFIRPAQRLYDVLQKEIPELERIVAERLK